MYSSPSRRLVVYECVCVCIQEEGPPRKDVRSIFSPPPNSNVARPLSKLLKFAQKAWIEITLKGKTTTQEGTAAAAAGSVPG
jgi:hypothetical protein